MEIKDAMMTTQTENGRTLLELAETSPVLLIFLRHFGCAFCRQAIEDVGSVRDRLESLGVRPVFVHLGTSEVARVTFAYYDLDDVERVNDPSGSLYRAFGLGLQVASAKPTLWQRLFKNGSSVKGEADTVGRDLLQMPGMFLLRGSQVVKSFVHRSFTDRPDYLKFARSAVSHSSRRTST